VIAVEFLQDHIHLARGDDLGDMLGHACRGALVEVLRRDVAGARGMLSLLDHLRDLIDLFLGTLTRAADDHWLRPVLVFILIRHRRPSSLALTTAVSRTYHRARGSRHQPLDGSRSASCPTSLPVTPKWIDMGRGCGHEGETRWRIAAERQYALR